MFNQKLKELRAENGLTQFQLATKLLCNQSMIARWEKGECEPTESIIKKTAEIFDVSTDYLLGRDEEWTDQTPQIKAPPILTDEEREALELFRAVNPKDRSKIITALEVYADAETARKEQMKKGG